MKVTKKDSKNESPAYIATEIREITTTDITYHPVALDLLREYLSSRSKQDKETKKKPKLIPRKKD